MSEFEVLDATDLRDQARWLRLWHSWEAREVSAHPQYVALFARPSDKVLCACLDVPGGSVLFPFILREIASEPWAVGTSATDVVTPYGYGGPFVWGSYQPRHTTTFWRAFELWSREHRVISVFARLSLFPEQLLSFDGEVVQQGMNVVRSLDLSDEQLWKDYEHKVRKNVKKAQREGITIEIDERGSRLDEFLRVYYETMQRRSADDRYFFSREFFEHIRASLTNEIAFFHAVRDGKVVSSELVLRSSHFIYSFLGGTDAEAFDSRPNDYLKHEIARWGIASGKRAFVLGGGYEDGDGIFKYKASFAPGGLVPFMTARRILDPDAYSLNIKMRLAWERSRGACWRPDAAFFPAYRSPSSREALNVSEPSVSRNTSPE